MSINPKNYFWLKDGRQIRSIRELVRMLKKMPEDVFAHHVTPEKNDFANWIRDIFKREDIAAQMQNAKTKEELLVVLKRPKKAKLKDEVKKVLRIKNIKKAKKPAKKDNLKIDKKVSPMADKKKTLDFNREESKKYNCMRLYKRYKTCISRLFCWFLSRYNKGYLSPAKKTQNFDLFKMSLTDFLLGVLVGILIAAILSKVL